MGTVAGLKGCGGQVKDFGHYPQQHEVTERFTWGEAERRVCGTFLYIICNFRWIYNLKKKRVGRKAIRLTLFKYPSVFCVANGLGQEGTKLKVTCSALGKRCAWKQWRWREFMLHFGGRLEGTVDWLNVGKGVRNESQVPGMSLWYGRRTTDLDRQDGGRSRTKAEFRSGRVKNSNSKRCMHPSVHGSTIHNSQDMETA